VIWAATSRLLSVTIIGTALAAFVCSLPRYQQKWNRNATVTLHSGNLVADRLISCTSFWFEGTRLDWGDPSPGVSLYAVRCNFLSRRFASLIKITSYLKKPQLLHSLLFIIIIFVFGYCSMYFILKTNNHFCFWILFNVFYSKNK